MAGSHVEVVGLRELKHAFEGVSDDVVKDLVWELEEAANPIRAAAQSKAATAGRNMVHTREWQAMRTGVSRGTSTVYVVPALRGRKQIAPGSKAAFAKNIQERALDPALEENAEEVIRRVNDFLDRVADHHGF